MAKRRVTVTVDEALLQGASEAVADGRFESVSAWVAAAMASQAETDERLSMLGEFVADHEAAHGEITDAELAEQAQLDRDSAAANRRTLADR